MRTSMEQHREDSAREATAAARSIRVISDNSKLTLDPDLDSYYAMAIIMDYAPKLADAAAQLDTLLGDDPQRTAAITADDRANAQFIIARVSHVSRLGDDGSAPRDRRQSLARARSSRPAAVESTWRVSSEQAETLRQSSRCAAIGSGRRLRVPQPDRSDAESFERDCRRAR